MANNNILFNAAFSAAAGFLTSAAYASAFATAVDGAIAAGNFSAQDSILMLTSCAAILSNRTGASSVVATLAAAAVTEFNANRATLLDVTPLANSVIGYNGSAQQTVTVLAANHVPGIYMLSLCGITRSAPTSGTLAHSDFFTPPILATAVQFSGLASFTTVAGQPSISTTRIYPSNGLGPIQYLLFPNSITGPLLMDFYASTTLIAKI